MNLSDTVLASCLVLWILYVARRWVRSSASEGKVPPGPKPKWLVGNLFDIPIQEGWIPFTEWRKRHGDIICVKALGNTMVILNSLEAITGLLDKRSNRFSYRPRLVMAGEVMGLDRTTPMIQYGDMWRKHRKLAHIALSPQAVHKYHRLQEHVANLYLQALLHKPEDFIAQLRLTTGRILMAMTYGLTVESADNDYITEAEHTLEMVGRALVPGTYIVDLLPILQYLPSWTPFISFKKEGTEGRQLIDSFVSRPFEHVRREIAKGKALPSFTLDTLSSVEQGQLTPDVEETIKWAAGSLYGAGGETTYAVVLCFILAMALYPETQRRAQAEIDRVVGNDRMPTLQDRADLPYVNAVITESLRWHVAVPLGIAHRSIEDDIYEGYTIKAGTIVMPNAWAISRDPQNYESPEEFIPERFLNMKDTKIIDPRMYAFGFGRRVCPGRHLAENSLFSLVSSILATFNITKKLDEHGNELPLKYEFSKGLISYPEPFECRIVPRSAKAVELINTGISEEN